MIPLTFTDQEQDEYRADFIKDCRRKAWESISHADWAGKKVVEIDGNMQRMDAEHTALTDELEKLANALDYHTVENREKRKELEAKRDALAATLTNVAAELKKAMGEIQNMSKTAAVNLDLAEHAKDYRWEDAPGVEPEENKTP